MKQEPIDPVAFARRMKERRADLGWSQTRLAKESGYSQTNIGWLESGKAKDLTKQAVKLAAAMTTTYDWLAYGKGLKEAGPYIMSREELRAAVDELPPEDQTEFRGMVTEWLSKKVGKKPGRKRPTHI